MREITELLAKCANREPGSHDRLVSHVESELRKMASKLLQSEPADALWQTTVLLNETWLRLVDQSGVLCYQNRSHFFGAAAIAMRRIAVENARKRITAKRFGHKMTADVRELAARMPDEDAVVVHELLSELGEECPLSVQVIEHLYFAGHSRQQTAEFLGISEYELNKKWEFARAWLRRSLSEPGKT